MEESNSRSLCCESACLTTTPRHHLQQHVTLRWAHLFLKVHKFYALRMNQCQWINELVAKKNEILTELRIGNILAKFIHATHLIALQSNVNCMHARKENTLRTENSYPDHWSKNEETSLEVLCTVEIKNVLDKNNSNYVNANYKRDIEYYLSHSIRIRL